MILYSDGNNFAQLQQEVVAWDPEVWFCDMAEGSYPVLKAFTTGINRVMQSNGSVIFTINGIRVEKTKQGIYIIDGKKILVK